MFFVVVKSREFLWVFLREGIRFALFFGGFFRVEIK